MAVDPMEGVLDGSVGRFGEETCAALADTYRSDLKRADAYWHTGSPLFDEAIRSLRSGLCILGGVENCGKSNFANCLAMGILDHTPDSLVVDLILDDTREVRIHQYAAAKGRLPMDLITIPNLMGRDDARRDVRKKAYQSLIDEYRGRLEIVDSSSWGDRGAYLEYICLYLRKLRARYPDRKIWVTLDAFDDPKLPRGVKSEERVQFTSQTLKELCTQLGIVIFAIKHLNKYNRGRWTSGDSFKGHSGLLYDAKLALIAYSEMGEMGKSASIYFHPDPKDYATKNPVLEVFFQKNKVGKFKGGRLYYAQWPEQYYCHEFDTKNQEFYDAAVAETVGVKKGYGK